MAEEYFPDKGDPSSNVGAFYYKQLISTLDEGSYFTLESQTISSLDLLPKLKPDLTPDASRTQGGATSRSNTTVYAILNKCRTVSGQRLLALWLQNPLKSKEKITLRQNVIEYFLKNTELRTLCYDDYLRKMPDLLRLAFKINKEKCSVTDLVKVYNAIKSAQSLYKCFQQISTYNDAPPKEATQLFTCVISTCDELGDFLKLIEDSIDLDNVDESGEYMVKPQSDENIARLTLELSSISGQARRQLSLAADEIGLEAGKNLKMETDADKGFILKVTKNNEQAVRGKEGFEQVGIVKNDGYRFTNKALARLSTKYLSAKEEYNSLAKYVIEDIINRAVMYDSGIIEFSMTITLIDVFVALSTAAVQNNYTKPLMLDSEAGRICLEKMRHPCIENQPDVENYVPNDITMSKDAKKFYLITGPNMGGKSTFIKSIAINVIMAQCGSMIPADDARISIIDGVFTRVGAGDRQMDGISTFMGEMLDMSLILKKATENSLVIIDELGRGTSTFDGFGLAWSISRYLATTTKCYTLFATHFHELTEMEEEIDTVGNLHVKAHCQNDKLTMLYDIGEGVCEESYGINVAQITQFPEHVIQMAKEKLKQFEEVPGFSSKEEVRDFVRDCVRDLKARP